MLVGPRSRPQVDLADQVAWVDREDPEVPVDRVAPADPAAVAVAADVAAVAEALAEAEAPAEADPVAAASAADVGPTPGASTTCRLGSRC